MFKPGQIWDRTYSSGNHQVGIILDGPGKRMNNYTIFVLDGWHSGHYVDWYHGAMVTNIREGKLVQLA